MSPAEPWIDHDEGVRVIPHPDGSFTYEALTMTPTPAELRAARLGLGLSQAEAAAMVHHKLRAWQKWEGGESAMHPALWELFRIKTGLDAGNGNL